MDRQQVISKIEKCLALAARGGTEEEASTAAGMASALALKYGIDLAAMQTGGTKAQGGTVDRVVFTDDKYHAWIMNLLGGLGELNNCKLYYVEWASRVEYHVIGREVAVQAVELMIAYLVTTVKRLNREAVKGRNLDRDGRKDFRNSFRLGCSASIRRRLYDRSKELKTSDAAAQAAVGANALVVLNHFEQEMSDIQSWMQDQGYEFKTSKKQGPRVNDGAGYRAGVSAGEKVGLDTQVATSSRPAASLR